MLLPTDTNPSSLTVNEAEALAFSTNKAVVDEVAPDPLTLKRAGIVVDAKPIFKGELI